MQVCKRCGCLCDPGDLINSICDDCRTQEKEMEVKRDETIKMLAANLIEQADGQIILGGCYK